jgi:hypothetical protein
VCLVNPQVLSRPGSTSGGVNSDVDPRATVSGAGIELELAPPAGMPLVDFQPVDEDGAEVGRVARVGVSVEPVLAPTFAQDGDFQSPYLRHRPRMRQHSPGGKPRGVSLGGPPQHRARRMLSGPAQFSLRVTPQGDLRRPHRLLRSRPAHATKFAAGPGIEPVWAQWLTGAGIIHAAANGVAAIGLIAGRGW